MNKYQINPNIQELRTQILLNKHYEEIISDMNEVLNKYRINLYISSFATSPDKMKAKDCSIGYIA